MNRENKELVVQDVRQQFQTSQASFLVNCQGMSVATTRKLRASLRGQGAQFKVAKATLMRLAAEGCDGFDGFARDFKNQVALVFAKDDVVGVAKTLMSFNKEHNFPQVISAFYESRVLTVDNIAFIATLPPKEILVAHVLGTMQAPVAQFVRLLQILVVRLLYVLKQVAEKNSQ